MKRKDSSRNGKPGAVFSRPSGIGPKADEGNSGFRRRHGAGVVLIALAMAVCVLAVRDKPHGLREIFAASGRASEYPTPTPPRGTISINEAELEDLIQLPGVGETLAQAILDERERHGPYHYPEDIMAAKGIGGSKLNGFRELLDMSE